MNIINLIAEHLRNLGYEVYDFPEPYSIRIIDCNKLKFAVCGTCEEFIQKCHDKLRNLDLNYYKLPKFPYGRILIRPDGIVLNIENTKYGIHVKTHNQDFFKKIDEFLRRIPHETM